MNYQLSSILCISILVISSFASGQNIRCHVMSFIISFGRNIFTTQCCLYGAFYLLGCPKNVLRYLHAAGLSGYVDTNMKPNMSDVVIFIFDRLLAIVEHVSFALKQKMLCIYYFLLKRKKLLGQANIWMSLIGHCILALYIIPHFVLCHITEN